MGITRGWRPALAGAGAAAMALAAIVAALGPALTVIPIGALRLVVGALLLVFGLQWLRKAILRASGWRAVRDEAAVFARERAEAASAPHVEHAGLDWYAFTISFKGVLLEGLEVAFIVITFGLSAATSTVSRSSGIASAALGALLAGLLVILVGALVRAPLAKVPENTLKFVVGIMLTTFGTFWLGEGFGVEWPLSDVFLLILVVIYLGASFLLIAWLKQVKKQQQAQAIESQSVPTTAQTQEVHP